MIIALLPAMEGRAGIFADGTLILILSPIHVTRLVF
jgi:hypothetical protein